VVVVAGRRLVHEVLDLVGRRAGVANSVSGSRFDVP
jgi:hypothetical protein